MPIQKQEYPEIRRFEADLDRCIKCGFCAYWCPVYREERVESSLTRGKNILVRSLLARETELTPAFARRLNKCTLCMSCSTTCPARADMPSVIVAARAEVMKAKGLSLSRRAVFRWLLPRRRLFGALLRVASRLQGLVLPRTEGTLRHLPLFLSALGRGRHIPSIAPRFLSRSIPEVNRPPVGVAAVMRVGYFAGCIGEYVFPGLARKTISLLTRSGVEVIVPRGQGCCGAPVFLGSGDFATGRRMADALVKAFAGVDYIVSDCATCTSAITSYVRLLADTEERKTAYARLGEKAKDISQFLVDVLKLPPAEWRASPEVAGKKLTWHDPCHLVRHLGVKAQPRQILSNIPGVQFVEMAEADRCCGMAGTFSIAYYDLSQKIADRKMAAIQASGADIVVTSCPGCRIQLVDGIRRHGMSQRVMHITEVFEPGSQLQG